MSENLPAVKNEAALLAQESLGDAKIDLPKITIGQGSPKAPARVGHFNSTDKTSVARLEGVAFVSIHPSRVLFWDQSAKHKNARCASDDAINPSARIQDPISPQNHGGCEDCPAGRWSSGETDREMTDSDFKANLSIELGYAKFDSKKPLCTEMFNLVLLDKESAPFLLQVSKHNVKEANRLVAAVKMMTLKKQFPGYGLTFDLWLTPMEGQGNRHLLNFSQSSQWKTVSIDEAKDRRGIAQFFSKQGQSVIAEKHREQDESHVREMREVRNAEIEPEPWPDEVPF